MPQYLTFLEYNIGLKLSSLFKLPTLNNSPHATTPSKYYKIMITLLQKYDLHTQELHKHSIKSLYNLIIEKKYVLSTRTPTLRLPPIRWNWIHHDIIPHYLRNFNYKLVHNILPIASKFSSFRLDSNTLCPLCSKRYETNVHLFHQCPTIQPLLQLVNDIHKDCSNNDTNYFLDLNHIFFRYTSTATLDQEIIPYLNTVLAHLIWKTRNKHKKQSLPNISYTLLKTFKSYVARRYHYMLKDQSNSYLTTYHKVYVSANLLFNK